MKTLKVSKTFRVWVAGYETAFSKSGHLPFAGEDFPTQIQGGQIPQDEPDH